MLSIHSSHDDSMVEMVVFSKFTRKVITHRTFTPLVITSGPDGLYFLDEKGVGCEPSVRRCYVLVENSVRGRF